METFFEIKGVPFGTGRPVICVPVTGRGPGEILDGVKRLTEEGVRMIEWRADCYQGLSDPAAVRGLLERMRPMLEETVLLFTIRTVKQGGHCVLAENEIIRLNEIAAASGAADIVDIEYFEAQKPERLIRRLKQAGVKVIASHHDFEKTPDDHILHMLFEQMYRAGVDFGKLAVMPRTPEDVLRLMKLTAEARAAHPKMPLITMAMGPLGTVSRVCGELIGSCVTFGTFGAASAPGQLPADELATVLDILHRGMQEA